VSDHACVCGTRVLSNGHHCLSCRKSAGQLSRSRHHVVNVILARILCRVGVLAILEPPWLLRGDGKRPDGTFHPLVGWSPNALGLHIWEDTLALSHISKTSVLVGVAASEAEVRKSTKYSNFIHSHIFIPVAIKTLGCWDWGLLTN